MWQWRARHLDAFWVFSITIGIAVVGLVFSLLLLLLAHKGVFSVCPTFQSSVWLMNSKTMFFLILVKCLNQIKTLNYLMLFVVNSDGVAGIIVVVVDICCWQCCCCVYYIMYIYIYFSYDMADIAKYYRQCYTRLYKRSVGWSVNWLLHCYCWMGG